MHDFAVSRNDHRAQDARLRHDDMITLLTRDAETEPLKDANKLAPVNRPEPTHSGRQTNGHLHGSGAFLGRCATRHMQPGFPQHLVQRAHLIAGF